MAEEPAINWRMTLAFPSLVAALLMLAALALAALLPGAGPGIAWPGMAARPALAQGPPPQPEPVTAGPYALRVERTQSNLTIGFVQFSLYLTEAASGRAVPDAQVILISRHIEEENDGWSVAVNTPQRPERYDARMNLEATGEWEIRARVQSDLGLAEAVIDQITVPTVALRSSGSFVFFGAFALILGGVVYLIWSVRRNNRKRRLLQSG